LGDESITTTLAPATRGCSLVFGHAGSQDGKRVKANTGPCFDSTRKGGFFYHMVSHLLRQL